MLLRQSFGRSAKQLQLRLTVYRSVFRHWRQAKRQQHQHQQRQSETHLMMDQEQDQEQKPDPITPQSAEVQPEQTKTKRSRGRPAGGSARSSSGNSKLDREIKEIEDGLARIFAMTALPAAMMPQPYAMDMQIVAVSGAEKMAPAIANLARNNPRLRAALLGLAETSAYGDLIHAAMCMAIPIAYNHGYVPEFVAQPFMPNGMQIAKRQSVVTVNGTGNGRDN
jgi:hypothetical protein